jgi:23S rRNA pseudouridine2605 synthase
MPSKKGMSITRALSKMGIASRTVSAELIRSGKVKIGNKIIRDPEHQVEFPVQNLFVEDQKVTLAKKVYLMMHKPKGVVTTRSDEKGRKTVYDLLGPGIPWIFPVGRLDKESSGLLLLTNDTAWGDQIVSPSSKLSKTYHVKINRPLKEEEITLIRVGLRLSDQLTYQPLSIHKIRENKKTCWLELTLTEGKNRQIRKTLEHFGCRVENLVRIKIGKLRLGELKPGEIRSISPLEIGIEPPLNSFLTK